MGYDLYGENPQNKKGEYFRNNIWWWSKLWEYACVIGAISGALDGKDFGKGHANDGKRISRTKAIKLAKALQASIDSGMAKEYSAAISKKVRAANRYNKKLINDKVMEQNWDANYPFTISNLKEFIKFVKNSGGFRIC